MADFTRMTRRMEPGIWDIFLEGTRAVKPDIVWLAKLDVVVYCEA